MGRLLSAIINIIFPRWSSWKMERFLGAKSEDFLEKFYEEIDKEE